jgi:hypothetical protein
MIQSLPDFRSLRFEFLRANHDTLQFSEQVFFFPYLLERSFEQTPAEILALSFEDRVVFGQRFVESKLRFVHACFAAVGEVDGFGLLVC